MTAYRWWTIRAWWSPTDRGLKLGPETYAAYRAAIDGPPAWWFFVGFWCRWIVIDTGLARMRRR